MVTLLALTVLPGASASATGTVKLPASLTELGEADHVYRCRPELSRSSLPVVLERTLDDVTAPGEVEGIAFDRERQEMLISCNRGAQIVLGMPRGLYQGYHEEIHEVFAYTMTDSWSAQS